jgi:GGDEF domain-containing protein
MIKNIDVSEVTEEQPDREKFLDVVEVDLRTVDEQMQKIGEIIKRHGGNLLFIGRIGNESFVTMSNGKDPSEESFRADLLYALNGGFMSDSKRAKVIYRTMYEAILLGALQRKDLQEIIRETQNDVKSGKSNEFFMKALNGQVRIKNKETKEGGKE